MDRPQGTTAPTDLEPLDYEIDERGHVILPEGYDPNIDHLILEDGEPVESLFNEKLYRILTEPLFSSWPGPGEGRPFLALANVGLFPAPRMPPLAPDVMLSVDVRCGDLTDRHHNLYLVWVMGKVPEVVIEFVSDRRGGEDWYKLGRYARLNIRYYAVFDPDDLLDGGVLRVFELKRDGSSAVLTPPYYFAEVGLGLTLWDGEFEGWHNTWLRWCDRDGKVIPTGRERAAAAEQQADAAEQQADAAKRQADAAEQQADAAKQRADTQKERADTEKQRADRLAARLRELGLDPEA